MWLVSFEAGVLSSQLEISTGTAAACPMLAIVSNTNTSFPQNTYIFKTPQMFLTFFLF